jgi:hypothetical protein
LTDEREALAGRAAEHYIHTFPADPSNLPNLVSSHFGDGPWQHCTLWEVEFVGETVNRIELNRRNNIEPGLFKT